MAFNPTTNEQFVWSDEQARPYNSLLKQGISLGGAGVLGAGAFGYALRSRADGTRGMDDIASVARTVGNLSPFQILNTFRAPEFLSPFTSPAYQGLEDVGGGVWQSKIEAKFLQQNETFDYLKKLTGLSSSELSAVGLTRGMGGLPDDQLASGLIFEKTSTQDIHGRLYSQVGDTRHLISDNVMLMQFTGETPSAIDLSTKDSPVNKAFKSITQVMEVDAPEKTFGYKEAGEFIRPKFVPIPGVGLSAQGSTYARAIPAFSMERFNSLASNLGEEVFGTGFTSTFKKVIGTGPGVASGPASHMYARFGMVGAGLVGTGLAIGELDWVRRKGQLPGQIGASAVVGFGVGALATRAGFGAKAGLFAGIASFAGQMILPGFDQGIMPGIASTYVAAAKARAIPINPFNYYRRTLEGFLPGVTSVSMGAAVGLGVLGAAFFKVPGTGKTIPRVLLEKYGHAKFGMAAQTIKGRQDVFAPKGVRDVFWDEMLDFAQRKVNDPSLNKLKREYTKRGGSLLAEERTRIVSSLYGGGVNPGHTLNPQEISAEMNSAWARAEDLVKKTSSLNPVNEALEDKLRDIAGRYHKKGDFVSRVMMQAEGLGEQLRHTFFGANINEKVFKSNLKNLGFVSGPGKIGMLFGAGFGAHQLLTGALLGSKEGYKELENVYSGKQLVEVGRGRLWELGGTPLEGTGDTDLRPHWYPIMMNRVRQKGIWGGGEDSKSPIAKFFVSNFTYGLERQTYYDRPYPVTNTAFSEIPLIGGILGATIGQIIKPSKIMHGSEWIRPAGDGFEYAKPYEGSRREPGYSLGAYDPGIPRSPYDAIATASDISSQARQVAGLMGYVANTASEFILGQDMYAIDRPRMASSGMLTSYRRGFWNMSLGGGGPVGEVVRRLIPDYPKEIERVNPILNSMPQWLPSAFRMGDPMARIPYGEAVLPGPGYAALHPELQGLDPEDYPFIYRYDILSQVAPTSKEFRNFKEAVYQQRANGLFSSEQEAWIDRIDTASARQWNVRNFDHVDPNAIELPGSGLTQGIWARAQKALRKQVAPLEYLVPGGFRPVQKLLGDRSMIEQYEHERMYGSATAFWDTPVRDWLRPSAYSLMNFMGYTGKPKWRRDADEVGEQFDQLEFYKWAMLAEQAKAQGDLKAATRYEYRASNTRMGINPQGNPLSLYWTLPPEDRAFFNAFAFAEGRDRKRILKMVPKDQKHLYSALWSRLDEGDPNLYAGGPTVPDTDFLYAQLRTVNRQNMPPEDWIGFHTDVDLRDIKVRYANEMGKDLHDYGLWESELKKAYSQPFLEDSTQYIYEQNSQRGVINRNISEMFHDGHTTPQVSVFRNNGQQGNLQLEYNDNRQSEIMNMLRSYLNGL